MFYTPIARMATRPGSGKLKDFNKPEICNVTPDLLMCTLLKSGAHLLKSNTIYELGMNELTGIIELREVGKSWINTKWGHTYADISLIHGKTVWLSEEEYNEIREEGY